MQVPTSCTQNNWTQEDREEAAIAARRKDPAMQATLSDPNCLFNPEIRNLFLTTKLQRENAWITIEAVKKLIAKKDALGAALLPEDKEKLSSFYFVVHYFEGMSEGVKNAAKQKSENQTLSFTKSEMVGGAVAVAILVALTVLTLMICERISLCYEQNQLIDNAPFIQSINIEAFKV